MYSYAADEDVYCSERCSSLSVARIWFEGIQERKTHTGHPTRVSCKAVWNELIFRIVWNYERGTIYHNYRPLTARLQSGRNNQISLPHSEPPEAACFPYSAALPRFAAAGSPLPGSLRFRGVRSLMSRSPFFAACTHPYSGSVLSLQFLAGSLYSCFQRRLYWLLLVTPVVFLCFWHVLHPHDFSISFWAWGKILLYNMKSIINLSLF